MVKEPKTLNHLFHATLKDIFYAEKKILTSLPKMAKAAHNADLKAALRNTTPKLRGRLLVSKRSLLPSTRSRRARSVMPLKAFSQKARRSWKNTKVLRPSMPA